MLSYLKRLENNPMIISVLNQKGGCGKTTISTNLAYGLKKRGIKTLLVDIDYPQNSALDWHDLSEGKLVSCVGLTKEKSFCKDLMDFSKGYHVVVVDGAGEISNLSGLAMKISDVVLIPVTPSPYDVAASKEICDMIHDWHKVIEVDKPRAAFIISRAIKNTRISGEIEDALKAYEFPVLKSRTSNYVLYQTSAAKGESIFCQGESLTASEFNSLIEEIIAMFIDRERSNA